MTHEPAPRIFISYALKDGAPLAKHLRDWFLAESLTVFQDIFTLQGGRDWWSQIDEVLKSKPLQHLVLVVTPAALASKVIRQEIRLARQEGKTVAPIRGPGLPPFHDLPRWLGQLYDLDIPEHCDTLLRALKAPSQQARVPMMVPEPPADFVARPREFGALKAKLLDGKGDAIAITAALKGAGGYGKTTLAQALAHDADIHDAFYDGTLWVALGERPENVLSKVSDLIVMLSAERPPLENLTSAAAKLGEALGRRRILLVIDDVWREQDLRPFLQGGWNTTRLITTRIDTVLPLDTARQPVDAMQADEAFSLLAAGLNELAATHRLELATLAARLGEWALLLKLVNGFLRDRVLKGRQPLAEAIAGVNKRLDAKGLVAFDARNETERTKAVARTIGVSLDLLDEQAHALFTELGVFPEDMDVPLSVIARLWRETGGLDELDTEDLLSELANLSLLLALDLEQKMLRLHDTVRHFLQDQAGQDGLVAQHKRLLAALDGIASADADAGAQRYYYQYLPHHLAAAAERDRLDALLLDPGWLKSKLAALHSPQLLVADYELHARQGFQQLIGRTLRLTMSICARDERQLLPQLVGRLMVSGDANQRCRFFDRAGRELARPALLPFRAGLPPPGAEIARIEGHVGGVTALCMLPDGHLASGSDDKTIRLWDIQAGTEIAKFEGHNASVTALAALPDGRLASGSDDKTTRLWNVETGHEVARFDFNSSVNALVALPNSRLVVGLDDGARVWDVNTNREITRLDRHRGPVQTLAVLPDGCIALGSSLHMQIWEVESGAALSEFHGGVRKFAVLSDGWLALANRDSLIGLWDTNVRADPKRPDIVDHKIGIAAAACEFHSAFSIPNLHAPGSTFKTIDTQDVDSNANVETLLGQQVEALTALPDGRLASGSNDKSIRIWDIHSGTEIAKFEGHNASVTALAALPDGRLASGSNDKTIRIWDTEIAEKIPSFVGHSGPITLLTVLPDNFLASGSKDGCIRLWNLNTEEQTARLEIGRRNAIEYVSTLTLLPDGCLALGFGDRYAAPFYESLRLQDLTTGKEAAFKGCNLPMAAVEALAVSPDGRVNLGAIEKTIRSYKSYVRALALLPNDILASGAAENIIRLWDTRTCMEAARLEGHGGGVRVLALLPDGRLASGSDDTTIRLWDTRTCAEVAKLIGHGASVNALAVLPEDRLTSASSDKTIRLWDVAAGTECARLEVDAAVLCLAAISDNQLVAGDALGRLHWLEVVD